MTPVGGNQQKTASTTLEVTPLMPFVNVVELPQEYLREQQEQQEQEETGAPESAAPLVDTLQEGLGILLEA